jgi:hypothetical protein
VILIDTHIAIHVFAGIPGLTVVSEAPAGG